MNELSWAATVRFVHQRANNCCEYCQTCQRVIGQAMHIEHINPHGGDHPDNLCLSCSSCNLSKAEAVEATDPVTGDIVPLFNPRLQVWSDHFEWFEDGAIVGGKTQVGRATVVRLRMNRERIVTARKVWIKAGAHPPVSD
jgi:MinD superfamily P-loop ATPase